MVVVAEHGEGGCVEPAHELAHESHAALLAGEVVARQHHQVGVEGVRHRDGVADALGGVRAPTWMSESWATRRPSCAGSRS